MQSLSNENYDSWLIWFLKGILFLGALVMVGRMFELQIIKGNYFKSLSNDNRTRRIVIEAPRGEIYARGGEILVGNKEGRRDYLLGSAFAHVSGYLGQVSEEEAGKVDPACIQKGPRRAGSFVGRGGLEEQYRCELRGFDGEELVEVDTYGEKIRTLGTRLPVQGQNLKTYIDFGLQKKVSAIFQNLEGLDKKLADTLKLQGKKGAAIVTDGKGQVLAFYSSPSFDPNAFLQNTPEDTKKVTEWLTDSDLPLFNRVIGGTYHPGSVFKIVTSIAALSEGKIDQDFTYDDPGVIKVNEFEFATWYFIKYGKLEGLIDLKKALARSTDTFFYKVGEFLGADLLAQWANKFGLGEKSGIDIPGEIAGLVPTPEWKQKVKEERWFLGNTYHMSIGQGDLTSTPIEVNRMTSVIASNGFLCSPSIARENTSCTKLDIDQKYITEVKDGMLAACETGGTAFPFFNFEPRVACKTGTAETDDEDKTHAWFTAFAPVDDEKNQIVVTIMVEKAGEGSEVAAPIAHEIFKYWFREKNKVNEN